MEQEILKLLHIRVESSLIVDNEPLEQGSIHFLGSILVKDLRVDDHSLIDLTS